MIKQILNLGLILTLLLSFMPLPASSATPPVGADSKVVIKEFQFTLPITAAFFSDLPGSEGVKLDTASAELNNSSTTGSMDGADIPDPPNPPAAPFMDIEFMPGPLTTDSRPLTGSPPIAAWTFRVRPTYDESGTTSVPVTLTWNLASVNAATIAYLLALQDMTTSTITNPRASPNYIYTGTDSMLRNFTLYARANQDPSVIVTFPNGGETVGGVVTVTAGASDPDGASPHFDGVSTVTFQYSADGGSTWTNIGPGSLASGTPASGTWSASWNTSSLAEISTYRIRATALDNLGASASDTSDANFSVSQIFWYITLNASSPLTGSLGKPGAQQIYNDSVIAANSPFASASPDVLDIPNPPAPPEGPFIDMWFQEGPNKLYRDARPHIDPTTWSLRVKVDTMGGNVTITPSYTNLPPSEVFVVLTDLTTGVKQNLKITPAYIYNQLADTIRIFDLTVKSNSPPAATVTFPNGGETLAGITTISAQVSEPDAWLLDYIAAASFYYASPPYTTWYPIGPGAQTSPGVYTASWNTLLVPEGTDYKVKVVGTDFWGATGEDTTNGVFTIIHQIELFANWFTGWNMWTYSLIATPPSNSAQLGDDIIPPPWVFHYNPVSGLYDLTDVATPGWAYWSKVLSNVTIDVKGFMVTDPVFALSTPNGWNQIGNPYNATVAFNSLQARKGGLTLDIGVASAPPYNWLSPYLFSYNPITGMYVIVSLAMGQIVQNIGYWAKINTTGVELLFPKP